MEVRMSRMMRHYRDWDYDNFSAQQEVLKYKEEKIAKAEKSYAFMRKVMNITIDRLSFCQRVAIQDIFNDWLARSKMTVPQGSCIFTQMRNAVKNCQNVKKAKERSAILRIIDKIEEELRSEMP